jgi:hypothetical protein
VLYSLQIEITLEPSECTYTGSAHVRHPERLMARACVPGCVSPSPVVFRPQLCNIASMIVALSTTELESGPLPVINLKVRGWRRQRQFSREGSPHLRYLCLLHSVFLISDMAGKRVRMVYPTVG